MLKKFLSLFAVCSTLMTSAVFADHAYIGAGVGLTARETEFKFFQAAPAANSKAHLGVFGVNGTGVLGYDVSLSDQYDVALEFFASGYSARTRFFNNVASTRLSHTSRYAFGVRLLPGFQFSNDVQTHLIIGYARGGFRINDNGVVGIINRDYNLNGYQIGGGLTLPLTCDNSVALRMDGVFTGYVRQSRTGGVFQATVPAFNTYRIRPNVFDTTVMLVFNF